MTCASLGVALGSVAACDGPAVGAPGVTAGVGAPAAPGVVETPAPVVFADEVDALGVPGAAAAGGSDLVIAVSNLRLAC